MSPHATCRLSASIQTSPVSGAWQGAPAVSVYSGCQRFGRRSPGLLWRRCGYRFPTAVQAAVLEEMLHEDFEQRKDVLIQARTGSGKSLAFVLPMLAALSESLYAVPTKVKLIKSRCRALACWGGASSQAQGLVSGMRNPIRV